MTRPLNWSDPSPLSPERTLQDELYIFVKIFNDMGYRIAGFMVHPDNPRIHHQFGNFPPEVMADLFRIAANGLDQPDVQVQNLVRISGMESYGWEEGV